MKQFTIGERTIAHVLQEAVRTLPDKNWIITDAGRVSYSELDRLSNRIARGLLAAGIRPGDRLMTMMPDTIELVAVWIACAKAGIIEVPVNTAYRGDILTHIVNDSGANTAVIGASFAERFADVQGRLGSLVRFYVLPPSSGVLQDQELPSLIGGVRAIPFAELASGDDTAAGSLPAESDLMAIMYTSGTTGGSKGVMVTHAHSFEYAQGVASALELDETDISYTSGLPLFHVAGRWGVVLSSAIVGASAVLPPQFSVSAYFDDIRRHGATATFLLGAMANLLQRQPTRPDDAENTLRKVLMCPLLGDVADFAERFGVQVATAYGSTEVNAPTVMPLGTHVDDNQIVGRVRDDKFEIMIADADDKPVPPYVVGEILVRPKQPWITMLGYWNDPEKTVAMWRNLWLHSGDAGRMDAHGNFYFVDRIQDTIRRRGENISSMEVESILSQHPAIAECAVFPVPSEFTEYEVMAAIVLKPGYAPEPEAIIEFLKPRMPSFMLPRYLDFVPALPKTQTSKVQKNALRAAGKTATTWDREEAKSVSSGV